MRVGVIGLGHVGRLPFFEPGLAVARGMGPDPRIGPAFLRAGIGYGGSCLPKDVAAFQALADQLGPGFPLLEEVRAINERGPARVVEKLRQELWHLEGKVVAVLGLAFKPDTDDLREAPSLKLVEALQAEDADVVVDGRNLFRPEEMRRAGLAYHSIGRAPVTQ